MKSRALPIRSTNRHHPRKRMIQYSEASPFNLKAAVYWIPAFAGMTMEDVADKLLNENPATAAGCARWADGGFSGPGGPGAGGGRHAAARSAPDRPARRVFGGARHWPARRDHASDRTIAGRPDG